MARPLHGAARASILAIWALAPEKTCRKRGPEPRARTVRMFSSAEAPAASAASWSSRRTASDRARAVSAREPATRGMVARTTSESLTGLAKASARPTPTAKRASVVFPKPIPSIVETSRARLAIDAAMLSMPTRGSSKKPISCRKSEAKICVRNRSIRPDCMYPKNPCLITSARKPDMDKQTRASAQVFTVASMSSVECRWSP
mmetsp:Transcript_30347/g.87103  ORF Transcript_30347/g.87103 Transcript_30347/m.87103 type:complete len:203 (+) Transcript_30347:1386-1994(+)